METFETSYCSRPVDANKYEEKQIKWIKWLSDVSTEIACSLAWMIVYNPDWTSDLRYITRKN